jgi:hypothetical protein
MPLFISSPNKPDLTSIKGQGMTQPEIWWQKSQIGPDDSWRGLTVQSLREVGVVGVLESQGTLSQLPQRPKPIPLPDFFLPQTVVTLDAGVGGRASLGRKDGNHSAGQTQPNHLTQAARMHVPARQAHIVVHLQKSRDPMVLPIPDQKSQDPLNATIELHRATDQARGQILPVQDHHRTLRRQVMANNEIDLMDVVLLAHHGTRQRRALARSVSPFAGHAMVSNQNPMNRANRRQGGDAQSEQLVANSFGPIETQRVPPTSEPGMGTEHQPFEGRTHASRELVRTFRLLQKPGLPTSLISKNPFVHPLATPLQLPSNPTDRLFLQPQPDAVFPLLDQPKDFFYSYAASLPHEKKQTVYRKSLSSKLSTMSCPFLCKRSIVM